MLYLTVKVGAVENVLLYSLGAKKKAFLVLWLVAVLLIELASYFCLIF